MNRIIVAAALLLSGLAFAGPVENGVQLNGIYPNGVTLNSPHPDNAKPRAAGASPGTGLRARGAGVRRGRLFVR